MSIKEVETDLARLRRVAGVSGFGSVQEVEQALFKVMAHKDISTIGPLLLLLTDDAEHDEVMFSLIHAAESFEDFWYVKGLLSVLSELCRSAPKWASIVLMRVLNNSSTRDELVGALHDAPPSVKETVAWLCDRVNERSPAFLSKTLPVILASKV